MFLKQHVIDLFQDDAPCSTSDVFPSSSVQITCEATNLSPVTQLTIWRRRSGTFVDYPTALTIGQSNGEERTCGGVRSEDERYVDIEFGAGEYMIGVEVCFDTANQPYIVAGSFKISTNIAVYGPYGLAFCSGVTHVMRGFQLNNIGTQTGEGIDNMRFGFDRCIGV